MSAALVRQALELVDEEVSQKNKRSSTRRVRGQDKSNPYYHKKKATVEKKDSEQTTEENIKKLLKLSKPVASTEIAKKIVARAVKGKPLLENREEKKEEYKSILFADKPEPEESFKKFEKEYFCS